ncbi:hypothetical protein FZEAL_5610, partial [Fusarium zealandicum]
MISNIASKLGLTVKPPGQKKMPVQPDYTSNDIPIPDTFLTSPPSKPITSHPIDFASSPLPQYNGRTAPILANVLSP